MEKNKTEKSTLYLVGTPIGNLADISERAKKVLSEVDFICAEDTRNTQKLLSAYGIKKELISYHEHNKAESGERIARRLLLGESCALVSDAGMPAISDPGEDLTRLCAERGIAVTVIPGPCALISALALSALSTRRFAFEGFLPAKAAQRKKAIENLVCEERTIIFYEAPHKLLPTLTDMRDILGKERKISLCREITKLNESVMRTTLSDACDYYEKNEPRGEYVLVLEGAAPDPAISELSPIELIERYIEDGKPQMEAIKSAARDLKMPKSELYRIYVENKESR
jgi:16S rRNA (cytidine1402-2'-O)-methyltransferase